MLTIKTSCPQCGQHYELNGDCIGQTAICSQCNAEFVVHWQGLAGATQPPAPPPTMLPPGEVYCTSCGAILPITSPSCLKCGAANRYCPSPRPAPLRPRRGMMRCPVCGNFIAATAPVCPRCGAAAPKSALTAGGCILVVILLPVILLILALLFVPSSMFVPVLCIDFVLWLVIVIARTKLKR